MEGARRARLELVFESGASFLADARRAENAPLRFLWRLPEGRSLPPDSPGDVVSATIRLDDRDADFHVHLRVVERRGEKGRPALLFEFLPEERSRQELVLACAEGESIPYQRRRRPRVACDLPIVLAVAGRALRGTCTTISVGGVHVHLEESLDRIVPDAVVQVDLELEGRRWRVPGRITSRIEDGPQRGVGIEFLFESARQRDEIAERVDALEQVSRHRMGR
jgi:hypothetical protein